MSIIFHPVEETILSRFLDVEVPGVLDELDLREPQNHDGGYIGLRFNVWGEYSPHMLANSVARIALDAIQEHLPQWNPEHGGSRVVSGRRITRPVPRIVSMAPRFLFEVSLADSDEGVYWPEAYYLTYIPGFDRYVVTFSHDAPDIWGYSDLAIVSFPRGADLKDQVRQAVTGWWWTKYRRNYLDRPAVHPCRFGFVTADEAHAWRGQVWPAPLEKGESAQEPADRESAAFLKFPPRARPVSGPRCQEPDPEA